MDKLFEQHLPPEELKDFCLVAEDLPLTKPPSSLRRRRWRWWVIAVASLGTFVALITLFIKEPREKRLKPIVEHPSFQEPKRGPEARENVMADYSKPAHPQHSFSQPSANLSDPNMPAFTEQDARTQLWAAPQSDSGKVGTEHKPQYSRSGAPPIASNTHPQATSLMEKYLERGIISAKAGRLDDALADLGEAIRIDPNAARPYHNRGVVWILKGRFVRAIADFTAAIEIDPQYALAYANRGLAYEKNGQRQKAQSDYVIATRLGMNVAPRSPRETYPLPKSEVDEKTMRESSLQYYRRRAAKGGI